ncbi:SPOR domain-containing protein [Phaeobacter porticola]|uniref:Sporulation related protein domain protein n=1 Tax=Phaeobacter porticola TaxID=1844006 RepID=A0A1L3I3A3_9RHOB|nr:SPOR domain-containing protein [Phaeobacter porticola]APG46537.1 Sporulation related protein domain protein [Phaeobacter porticola]
MAYFTQAGHGQSYSNGGDRSADSATETQRNQQPYAQQNPAQQPQYGFGQTEQAHAQSAGGYFAQPVATPAAYGAQAHAQPGYQGHGPSTYGDPAQDAYSGPGTEQGHRYDDYGFTPEPAGVGQAGLGKAFSVLGAAASLALVAGIGLWGYQLIARDVSGVPVVRAVEGPLRVQPESPGGLPADHQGLAVNAVAANGNVERPADRLTLAPEDVTLTEDDQPMQANLQTDTTASTSIISGTTDLSVDAVAAYQGGEIDALVAELTDGVTPLGQDALNGAEQLSASAAVSAPAIVQPEPLQPVIVAAATPAPNAALRNAPGVRVSLRPSARPARFSPTRASAVVPAAKTTQDVAADSLPAGTRLAQLGAYESAEVARAEWDRIHGRFADYLEGKKRVIQKAESGGRTFYRLRAMGFADLSDARRFCSALVAGNADCIPVTTR